MQRSNTAVTSTTPPDHDRYSAFYAAYHRRHVGLIRSLYRAFTQEECEDIVNTAYLHLWQHWPELRDQPDKAVSAWLDTTASRRAIDLWRRKQLGYRYELSQSEVYALARNVGSHGGRNQLNYVDADPIALLSEYVVARDGATDPERWAVARERLAQLKRRVEARCHGERAWQTFALVALGYSHSEIGAMQGRSTPAVKNDVMRTRHYLGIADGDAAATATAETVEATERNEVAA